MAAEEVKKIIYGLLCMLQLSALGHAQQVFEVRPDDASENQGSDVTFRCKVYYQYFNNKQLYSLLWYRGIDVLVVDGSEIAGNRYRIENAQDGWYNLKVRNITYPQDDVNFRCVVNDKNSGKSWSESAKLTVLVKPGAPRIQQIPEGPVVEGNEVKLTCSSSGGNPAPTIQWFANNTKEIHGEYIGGDATTPTKHTITIPASRKDNNNVYTCYVYNIVNANEQKTKRSTPLQVHYHPYVTFPYQLPYRTIEGTRGLTIECHIDANPPATRITWLKADKDSQTFDVFQPLNTSPQLFFPQITKSDLGTYKCQARNDIGNAGEDKLFLDVQYAPRVILANRVTRKVGEALNLTCETDANPPPTSFKWFHYQQVVGHLGSLRLYNIRRQDAGNYSCAASNVMTRSETGESVHGSGRGSTTLAVLHKPGKARITPAEPIVLKDQNITMTCSADEPGEPPASYRWWRQDSTSQPTPVLGARYEIPVAYLTHENDYTCEPYNSVGSGTTATVHLTVVEEAKFVRTVDNMKQYSEGDRGLVVSCAAKGKPAPQITWYKDGAPLVVQGDRRSYTVTTTTDKLDTFVDRTDSQLSWSGPGRMTPNSGGLDNRLTRLDGGHYECRAFNGYGRHVSSNLTLYIQHRPVLSGVGLTRPVVAVPVGKGRSAQLNCIAEALPSPTFRWFSGLPDRQNARSAEIFNATNNHIIQNYHTEDKPLDKHRAGKMRYVSKLIVMDVHETDLKDYTCQATNKMGVDRVVVTLRKQSKPEAPAALQVFNSTHNSILLQWVPGFDGGYPQQFRVVVTSSGGNAEVLTTDTCNDYWLCHYQVTSLQPETSYSMVVYAINEAGQSQKSNTLSHHTPSKPLTADDLPTPQGVAYVESDRTISFYLGGAGMGAQLCAVIEVRQPDWDTWKLYDDGRCFAVVTGHTNTIPLPDLRFTSDTKIRAWTCSRNATELCSKASALAVIDNGDGGDVGWWVYVVAILVAIVLVMLVVVCVFYMYKRKGKTAKARGHPRRKDYEMDQSNGRKAGQNGTSGAAGYGYQTDAPRSNGLDLMDHTDLSKYSQYESGLPNYSHMNGNGLLYTTDYQKKNYDDYSHYPPQQEPGWDSQQQPKMVDLMTDSSQPWDGTGNYGNPPAAAPYTNGYMPNGEALYSTGNDAAHSGATAARPNSQHATNNIIDPNLEPYSLHVSGLPDPYSGQVDYVDYGQNGAPPSNGPPPFYDESLESGYSTPNSANQQKKVYHEVIV